MSKLCPRCSKRERTSGAYCAPCRHLYYVEHQDLIKAQVKVTRDELRVVNNAIIRAAKSQPCADCGVSYPFYVMDLDHVRGIKYLSVSAMTSCPTFRVRREIAKCDAVCANCHRRRTHDRLRVNHLQSLR